MPSLNFCTTSELAAELGDVNLGVIDASWHLPNTGRIGAAEFRLAHIPGAVFFDIDAIADRETSLPHMLPKSEMLAKEMGALGLGDGMHFVVAVSTCPLATSSSMGGSNRPKHLRPCETRRRRDRHCQRS